MNKRIIILAVFIVLTLIFVGNTNAQQDFNNNDEIIFAWGSDINLKFTEYVSNLTQKEKPIICFLPTASADGEDNIKYWESICNVLKIDTVVLKVWVSASKENESFEKIILNSDAIVVGGGNTLNMLAIWKAQGIDTILAKALKMGKVLAGGSAGSICWFQNGISDSRPVNLSIVEGLGFLPFSNCPHYSQESRKNLYHEMLAEGKMESGYATDELAGILFKNGKAVEFLSQSDTHNNYYVSTQDGRISSNKMDSKILLRPNALPEDSYEIQIVQKKISDLLPTNNYSTPLNAYASQIETSRLNKKNITELEKEKALSIGVEKIFVYDNKIAGVVNDAYLNSFGYGVWYFYNCNGTWISIGEDIGGETLFKSEITFREKAKIMLKRAEKKNVCK